MVREAAIFSEDLNNKHIEHSVVEDTAEKSTLKIFINMGELTYNVYVIAESDHTMTFRITDLAKFTDEQTGSAIQLCNALNRDVRWAKFYLSADNEIIIDDNEVSNDSMTAETIFALVGRNMQTAGTAFAELKKAGLA